METEKPHRTRSINGGSSSTSNGGSSASELFICFTTRPSASQMTLYNSLSGSRRLRSSGSVKGGLASPMLAAKSAGGRKRGCGFEINPEPSSPKVTCIGQVRVKAKKKQEKSEKKGEESEKKRTFNHNDNNKHFPVTICEAFNCLFPCRSSCLSGSNDIGCTNMEEERELYGRWAVAVEDGEKNGGGVEEEEVARAGRRRHVFDGIEFDEINGVKEGKIKEEDEEEGRVGLCMTAPPKNALLLMRCRSDPMKMAALTNRFWEPTLPHEEEEEDEEEAEVKNVEEKSKHFEAESKEKDEQRNRLCGESVDDGGESEETDTTGDFSSEDVAEEESDETDRREDLCGESADNGEGLEETDEKCGKSVDGGDELEETDKREHLCGEFVDIGKELEETDKREDCEQAVLDEETLITEAERSEKGIAETSCSELLQESSREDEIIRLFMQKIEEDMRLEEELAEMREEEEETEVLEENLAEPEEREIGLGKQDDDEEEESDEGGIQHDVALPECLLLMMMCEPKLSMEVSRETWVRPLNPIGRLSEKIPPVNRSNGGNDPNKKIQPHRSSCYFPAAAATVLKPQAPPYMLPRCKSEPPIRSYSAKLVPENWNLNLSRICLGNE